MSQSDHKTEGGCPIATYYENLQQVEVKVETATQRLAALLKRLLEAEAAKDQ